MKPPVTALRWRLPARGKVPAPQLGRPRPIEHGESAVGTDQMFDTQRILGDGNWSGQAIEVVIGRHRVELQYAKSIILLELVDRASQKIAVHGK